MYKVKRGKVTVQCFKKKSTAKKKAASLCAHGSKKVRVVKVKSCSK